MTANNSTAPLAPVPTADLQPVMVVGSTPLLGSFGSRFRAEVLIPAGLSWDEVAKCDPQEMAMFCFLAGAGVPWDEARMVENLNLPNNPVSRADKSP